MKKVLFLISVLFSGYSFAESSLIGRFSSSRYTIDACPFSESAMTPMDVYWFGRCSVGKQFTIHDQTILVTDFKIIRTSVYFLAKVYNRDSEVLWFTFSTGDRNYDTCEAPDYINPNSGYCVAAAPTCEVDLKLGRIFWKYSTYGDFPTFCGSGCESKPYVPSDGILCSTEDDRCFADLAQTGESCTSNGASSGGDFPTPPPDGCIWTGTLDDRVLSCSGDADGDGEPDDDTPLDPDSKCDWDGDTLVCNGGTYPDDPDKPDKPDTGGGTDSGGGTNPNSSEVIKVIKDFNKDNNSNLNKINETNSTSLDEVKNSIDALRSGGNDGVNDGKPGSLAAIEEYLDETLGAQYEMNAQLDKLNNSSSKDYSSVLNGIHSEVASSGSSLRQIIDTDISGANFTDCYSSNSCTSLYESEYSEYKDMSELVAEKVDNISTGAIRQVTNMFTHIDVSNAQKPNTNMCVDIIYDFGCYDLFKDFSYIWAFVRFCFIFTSLALARKLVFGG
jgi:hypothetical protein